VETQNILCEGYFVFVQSIRPESEMIPRLVHDHFHPNPFSKFPYTRHLTIGVVYLNKCTGSLNMQQKEIGELWTKDDSITMAGNIVTPNCHIVVLYIMF
jgi:hypothetical protein